MFGRLRKSVQQEASRALRSVAAARQAALATWNETKHEPEPEPYFAPILPPGVVPPPPADWLNYVNAKLEQNFGETYSRRGVEPGHSASAPLSSIAGASLPAEVLANDATAARPSIVNPKAPMPHRAPRPFRDDTASVSSRAQNSSPTALRTPTPFPRSGRETPFVERHARDPEPQKQPARREREHTRIPPRHVTPKPSSSAPRSNDEPSRATPSARGAQSATGGLPPTADGSLHRGTSLGRASSGSDASLRNTLWRRAWQWLDGQVPRTASESLSGVRSDDRQAKRDSAASAPASVATSPKRAMPLDATPNRAVPSGAPRSVATSGVATSSVATPTSPLPSLWEPASSTGTAEAASSRLTSAAGSRGVGSAFAPQLFTFNHSTATATAANQATPNLPPQKHAEQSHPAHSAPSRTANHATPGSPPDSKATHQSFTSPSSRGSREPLHAGAAKAQPRDATPHVQSIGSGHMPTPFVSSRQAATATPLASLPRTPARAPAHAGMREVTPQVDPQTLGERQSRFVAVAAPREVSRGRWPSLPPSDGETASNTKQESTPVPIDAEQRFA